MKATEIVRRIDDLGRVVIPNEICRTMRNYYGHWIMRSVVLFRETLISTPTVKSGHSQFILLKKSL